jgi:Flp pilus assembly protein TadB
MYELIWVLVPITAIAGAFATAMVATRARARVRELEIRERIAMIEKGLMPSPEVDPRGFDRAMDFYDRAQWSTSSARHRRAGIVLLAIGVGLFLMIGVAGNEPNTGIGVGGFVGVLGLAFLINSLFERQQPAQRSSSGPGSGSGSVPGGSGAASPTSH